MHPAAVQLLAGVALDLVFGDPRRLPHPVRLLGAWIRRLERWTRAAVASPRAAGVLLWVGAVGTAAAVVGATADWLGIYWTWTLLAVRDLDRQSLVVVERLDDGDFAGAREALARIVGRDVENLDEPEMRRAVIETVAENLSDGVVAPLFYFAVGGPAAMAAYKAINTLDSMVGYRDERYRDFGWFSARADDCANLIPARLTAALVWAAAPLAGADLGRSIATTRRDASSQPSPNAGWPEAAFAGALGVRLGGLNFYSGEPSPKAFLGDPLRPLDAEACRRARRLLYVVSLLSVAAAWAWIEVVRG